MGRRNGWSRGAAPPKNESHANDANFGVHLSISLAKSRLHIAGGGQNYRQDDKIADPHPKMGHRAALSGGDAPCSSQRFVIIAARVLRGHFACFSQGWGRVLIEQIGIATGEASPICWSACWVIFPPFPSEGEK